MGATVTPTGLTLLSQPEDGVIDIVFVHGLQGHPKDTWCKAETSPPKELESSHSHSTDLPERNTRRLFSRLRLNRKGKHSQSADCVEDLNAPNTEEESKEVFWPRDLLTMDFPQARIMTFGYNSKVTKGFEAAHQGNMFSHARNLLYDLEAKRRRTPNRDLVFVAHSLGGILVKEVLRRSEVDPDPKIANIFHSTTGILFFGTPHRGSRDWASFGEGVAKVANLLLGMDVNAEIVHGLLPTSPELELCRESFVTQWVKYADRLTVRTFQESKGITGVRWGGFNKLIVPPDSSTLDHPRQRARTIDADHIEMVKFAGKEDKSYEMVRDDIEELVVKAQEAVHLQNGPKYQSRGSDFLDQKSHLSNLKQANRLSNNVSHTEESVEWFTTSPEYGTWISKNECTFLWLHGPPGDGKTVIASHVLANLSQPQHYSTTWDIASVFCSFKDSEIDMVASLAFQLIGRIDRAEASEANTALPRLQLKQLDKGQLAQALWRFLQAIIVAVPEYDVFFILDGIDKLDLGTRSSFLKAFRVLQKRTQPSTILRVLVSSREYPDIKDALGDYSSIEKGKEWKGCVNSLYFHEWDAREQKVDTAINGGAWLDSNQEYSQWLTAAKSDLLWIVGKPGSGKSTLAKRVVSKLRADSELRSRQPERADLSHSNRSETNKGPSYIGLKEASTIVASFYYSFRGGVTETSHELMLRSILYQILRENSKIFPLIRDQYRNLKKIGLVWGYRDLKTALHCLHKINFELQIIIVVDGLDESDHVRRDDVLNFISSLPNESSRCIVKVLIASRPEIHIKTWMSHARSIVLERENEKDIRLVVQTEIKRLERLRTSTLRVTIASSEQIREEDIFSSAERYILENSRGVFLWVGLVLRDLEACIKDGGYSLTDIDDRLSRLPKELGGPEGFYWVMVDRLVERYGSGAHQIVQGRRILCWITFSTRPLLTAELRDAMAVPFPSGRRFDLSNFDLARNRPFDFEQGLSSFCGGLAEVQVTQSEERVQLIHQSAREFLLGRDHAAKPYDIDEIGGDTEIALTCCRYLRIAFMAPVLQKEANPDFCDFSDCAILVEHLANHSLLKYAISTFATHLDHLEPDCVDIRTEFENFVSDLGNTSYSGLILSQWITSLNWPRPLRIPGGVFAAERWLESMFMCAATSGESRVLEVLHDLGANVNAQGGEYGSALQAAACRDYRKVVRLLLEQGADPNAQGGKYYGSALQAASYEGHEAVVLLLLERGADPNAQGGEYGNALQAASKAGHETVVLLLLERGADPNAQGGEYGNALQAASYEGHEGVVRLLLKYGVDLNAQGGKYYGSALQAASYEGHEAMVLLLLERGADPNAQGGEYGSALQAASYEGHEGVVRLLLKYGADPP